MKHKPILLNIGANKSLVLEKEIEEAGCDFIEDRSDVLDPSVSYQKFRHSFICSVENMDEIPKEEYDLAFANFVLEHVPNLDSSAREIEKILKKNSYFVASIPNPQAPEFKISKITPLWFHQWIRGEGEGHEAHETEYSYKSIKELIDIFEKRGLKIQKEYYRPFTYGYLYRFPLLKHLSKFYDAIILKTGSKRLMGNVCLVFRKI